MKFRRTNRLFFLPGLAAAAIAGSVRAQTEAPPPVTAGCEAAAAERARLEEERGSINAAIADIALGRQARPKKKVKAADVGQAVAGTAATILLPFGIGAVLNAGVGAARRSGRKAEDVPTGPDVPAMIARVNAVEARLAELKREGCAG